MARHWFLLVSVLASSFAFADCGDITKGLFGFEIGGPRIYLRNLPTGFSLSPIKYESLTAGVDAISGQSPKIDLIGAQIQWHDNRVVSVLATIRGTTDADIDRVQSVVLGLSGTDFLPNSIPPNEFLRCRDGLNARIARSQIVRSKDSVTPLLVLSIENSMLRGEMQAALRPSEQHEKDLISAAEGGDARAQIILAKSFVSKNDRAQARQWLRRAAEAGSAEGQYELGRSLGIFSDPESWDWFEKAASQGHEQTFSYVRGVMAFRICDPQYGGRYLHFLKGVVKRATQHEKVQKSAQAALNYANRFREGDPQNCN